MLTEECHLNPFLAEKGIEVIDSDLGERIVQLAGEVPSHIVLPCIHWKKEEIGILFEEHLDTEKGNFDPQYLTEAARNNLREKFLTRKIAITGVNFAIAETGTAKFGAAQPSIPIFISFLEMSVKSETHCRIACCTGFSKCS